MKLNKANLLRDLQIRLNDGSHTDGFLKGVSWVKGLIEDRHYDCSEVADSEMKSLQERLDHKDKQIDWLVRDYAEMRNERTKYKQQYAQGCKNQISLNESLERLQKRIPELEAKIDELSEEPSELEPSWDHVKILQDENGKLQRQIEEGVRLNERLQGDIKSYLRGIRYELRQGTSCSSHGKVAAVTPQAEHGNQDV